ncbi:HIT family protein [Actinosynnema sp. CA-248983]
MTRVEYSDWLQTLGADDCALCNWQRYQIVLLSTDHWLWILNRAPYWRFHTMLIPKAHRIEMCELSVVEVGELFSIYGQAVAVLHHLQPLLPEAERADRYIFFWRLRSEYRDRVSGEVKVSHFHLHLAPDQDKLFDPLLDDSAAKVDFVPLINLAAQYRNGKIIGEP